MREKQDCENCVHLCFDTRLNVEVCECGYVCQFEPIDGEDDGEKE